MARRRLARCHDARVLLTRWNAGPGRRLYLHNKVDHARLFAVAAKAKGPVILTYDDTSEIRDLAKRHYYKIEPVPMKNTHHAVMYELVVSNAGSCLDARQ